MKRGQTERLDGEDGPQWETLRERRGPAVQCESGCGVPIEPGDLYVEIAGVWDGEWHRVLLHEGCYDQLNLLAEAARGPVEFGRVAEYAREDGRIFEPVAKEWREVGS